MFSNSDSGKKPSLLTLANRQAQAARGAQPHENVVQLNAGGAASGNGGENQGDLGNSLRKLLRLSEADNSSAQEPGFEAAMASIERDMHAHVHGDVYQPLIDPRVMLGAIWRWRWIIAGSTIIGCAVGAMIAISTPHTYTAYSQVLIDPRQVKLVERDLTPEFLGNESALAIVDSQLESVYSSPVLQRVIDELGLNQDAEFNGLADSGIGLFDGIAFVRSLFSAETPIETSNRITIENLRDAISAERTSRTFIFEISAESQNQRRAAEIANALTDAFIENQREREALAARNATAALGGQLVELKAAVETAERAAESFAQSNNLSRVEGLTLSENQVVATSAQLNEAQAATIRAKSLADAAQSASVDSVVNGALPPELVNSALITFRAQFASLSQNAASLEQALGPRHPRLANAIAAREAARDEIAAELQRIVAGTQSDLRRAVQNEQQIAAALAKNRAAQSQDSEAMITLRELEAEIEAAKSIYKAALLRSRETDQLENLVSVNATIISEAEPPLTASSLPRRFVALTGLFIGLAIGIGMAVLAGLRDSFVSKRSSIPERSTPSVAPSGNARRQNSPHDRVVQPASQLETNQTNAATAQSENPMYRAPYHPYASDQQLQQTQQHAPSGYAQQGYAQQIPDNYPQPMIQPQYGPAPQTEPAAYHTQSVQPPMYDQPLYPAMPMQQDMYAQPFAGQMPPPAAPYTSYNEDMELEELRASIREIREAVDHLTQTRSARRRFG